MIVIYLKLYYW